MGFRPRPEKASSVICVLPKMIAPWFCKLSTKVANDKSLCKSIDKLFTSKTKTKSVVKKVKKLGDSVFFNTIKEINKALAK